MALRRPLVVVGGVIRELPSGDTLPGGDAGNADGRSDPAFNWFGPSGSSVVNVAGEIAGDPFLVEVSPSSWLMFYFRTMNSGASVGVFSRTASSLEGPWSSEVAIPSLDGFHKPAVLVDVDGNAVQVGGKYHLYAVSFTGDLGSKEIHHFTATTLTGAWARGSKVIPKGASGARDSFNTDAPYAILHGGQIYIWYMAAPSVSFDSYGLATRMVLAQGTDPDGPFAAAADDVLLPNASAAWNHGWLGGAQVRRRPNGQFLMVLNAGDTRASSAGHEPDGSSIGYAHAASLSGPWKYDTGNPYQAPKNIPAGAVESLNIWRGHLAYDRALAKWYLFYNTGGNGSELITFAREGVYEHFYGIGPGFDVQTITAAKAAVQGSSMWLPPGIYSVRVAINVIGDSGGPSTPKLDVDTVLRLGGVDYRKPGRDFIGSYAYENRDLILEHAVVVTSPSYVDFAIYTTGGTPGPNTKARRLRVLIRQLRRH